MHTHICPHPPNKNQIYVCMSLCQSVSHSVCPCVSLSVRQYVCIHARMHACLCVCLYVCMHAYSMYICGRAAVHKSQLARARCHPHPLCPAEDHRHLLRARSVKSPKVGLVGLDERSVVAGSVAPCLWSFLSGRLLRPFSLRPLLICRTPNWVHLCRRSTILVPC